MLHAHLPRTTALVCLFIASVATAAPPTLKTRGTVIHLIDNLDEADNLGWCIDTVGRGFAERLHAHSCKPRGGDVQFGYNAADRQIYSVEFSGKCMTLAEADDGVPPFALLDCDTNNPAQAFVFNEDSGEIQPASDTGNCVVVGQASKSAGPFMSRELLLEDCQAVDDQFKQWRYQR